MHAVIFKALLVCLYFVAWRDTGLVAGPAAKGPRFQPVSKPVVVCIAAVFKIIRWFLKIEILLTYITLYLVSYVQHNLYSNLDILYACMVSHFKLCPTLCDPVEHSPPGSSVHGILQAKILECVAFSSSRVSSLSRDWTCVSYTYLHWPAGSVFVLIFHIKGHMVFLSLSDSFYLAQCPQVCIHVVANRFPSFFMVNMYVCVCVFIHLCHIFFYPYIHQ